MSEKKPFIKRGNLTLRKCQNNRETLYAQLTINDPEIIEAIEKRCVEGNWSPTRLLSDFIKRAYHQGVKL